MNATAHPQSNLAIGAWLHPAPNIHPLGTIAGALLLARRLVAFVPAGSGSFEPNEPEGNEASRLEDHDRVGGLGLL